MLSKLASRYFLTFHCITQVQSLKNKKNYDVNLKTCTIIRLKARFISPLSIISQIKKIKKKKKKTPRRTKKIYTCFPYSKWQFAREYLWGEYAKWFIYLEYWIWDTQSLQNSIHFVALISAAQNWSYIWNLYSNFNGIFSKNEFLTMPKLHLSKNSNLRLPTIRQWTCSVWSHHILG